MRLGLAVLVSLIALWSCLPSNARDGSLTFWSSTQQRRLLGFELPQGLTYALDPAEWLRVDSGRDNATRGSILRHRHDREGVTGAKLRCALVRGTWCLSFLSQTRQPYKPVPRGSRECPSSCSGWGNCNYDTGICDCPAGRGGADCGQEVKRPCAGSHRGPGDFNVTSPKTTVAANGLDYNVNRDGWTASRCFGYCSEDIAACFCGEGKLRRIPAPAGSPPWTPPVQWGRTLADSCQPKTDATGKPSFNRDGGVRYEEIYGPEGWCNKLDSKTTCHCFLEVAHPCDGSNPMETTCVNQCAGHGDCHFGYCRCHPGWYGQDCSRKKAGLAMELALQDSSRPWLRDLAVMPPAALPSPSAPTRPRPLIYVYDVPPAYTSRMLQYRVFSDACVWRRWYDGNNSSPTGFTYSIEMVMHEMMLQSEHRTFDPEEADFFYVPIYIGCYFWPVLGWADYPWWHAPIVTNRPMHATNMVSELHRWLTTNYPWWARRGGRDHIWLTATDEGACYMPTEVYNSSIILTHWGRMDRDHTSNSAYEADNYSQKPEAEFLKWPGMDYAERMRGHPCYNPKKDLVIPAFKAPDHFRDSPLLGGPPLRRDILLYFRGDVGAHRLSHYSRGIRQKLFQLSVKHNWFEKHNIVISTGGMVAGEYSEHLSRSKFCLVAPGDGWSPRAEDAILHGCVPLVVMDGVHAVWESILDWEAFSVRIRESALEAVPDILTAIPAERLAKMQRNILRVWHRFAYTSSPFLRRLVKDQLDYNKNRREHRRVDEMAARARLPVEEQGAPFLEPAYESVESFPFQDDAFGTLMQWLYNRTPDTR